MILQCQRDSYMRKFKTVVKEVNKNQDDNYEIILEDTILFPEGGGQPSDFGTINGIPLIDVKKIKGKTIHTIAEPLEINDLVSLELDWDRRFEHMQQHSGQHLLSALAESLLGYKTTSWNLGEEVSFVELDTPSIKDHEIQKLEQSLNEKILEAVNLQVNLYKPSDPELLKIESRLEVPDGDNTLIRVITIDGIDVCTCCGTHVSNLSQLQCVKLLYSEKGKKNKTNLYFLFGTRVLKYLSNCVERERKEIVLLKCNPKSHVQMIETLHKNLKTANKRALQLLKDLAISEAKLFKKLDPKPKFYPIHKQDVESDFFGIFLNEVNDKEVLFFLTCGDIKGAGQMVLSGPSHMIDIIGPKVCEMMEGKGNGKNGKFQGKVNKLNKKDEAVEIIQNEMQSV